MRAERKLTLTIRVTGQQGKYAELATLPLLGDRTLPEIKRWIVAKYGEYAEQETPK